MGRYYYIILLFVSFSAQEVLAQQRQSRPAFTSLQFTWNPALTAVDEYLDFGASYRQDWVGFEQAPRTMTAYVQVPFAELSMSAGAYLQQEKAGALTHNQLGLTYSYNIELGLFRNDLLAFGLMAGIEQWRFSEDNLTASINPDPFFQLNQFQTAPRFNAGAGIYYASNRDLGSMDGSTFFVGIGSQQLLLTDYKDQETGTTLFRAALHANALIGYRLILSDYTLFEPRVWFDYSSPDLSNVTLNLRYEVDEEFWVATNISTEGTVNLQFGYQINGELFKEGLLHLGIQGGYNFAGELSSFQGMSYQAFVAYRFWTGYL